MTGLRKITSRKFLGEWGMGWTEVRKVVAIGALSAFLDKSAPSYGVPTRSGINEYSGKQTVDT